MAFIGVLALVECGQERIEHTVVAFKALVQKDDFRLRNLSGGLHDRLVTAQQCHRLAVGLQLVR